MEIVAAVLVVFTVTEPKLKEVGVTPTPAKAHEGKISEIRIHKMTIGHTSSVERMDGLTCFFPLSAVRNGVRGRQAALKNLPLPTLGSRHWPGYWLVGQIADSWPIRPRGKREPCTRDLSKTHSQRYKRSQVVFHKRPRPIRKTLRRSISIGAPQQIESQIIACAAYRFSG